MANENQMQVSVPTELSNIGQMVQSVVSDLRAKKNVLTVVSGVLPTLFAEGGKMDEIKAELKDPQVYVLAGLVLGAIIAKIMVDKAAAAAAVPAAQ